MKKLYVFIGLLSIFMFLTTHAMFFSEKEISKISSPPTVKTAEASFAGGCFWCTEADFEKLPGVLEVVSGYTGGKEINPTYQQVSAGKTSHYESVHIVYDPTKISYNDLLDRYWRHINPTDAGGSFVDRGNQYRSAIFYYNDTQKDLAETSKKALEASGKYDSPIVTQILPARKFYPAEEYHQDYYKKNPLRYKFYRSRSGRDQYLEKTWAEELSIPPSSYKDFTMPDDATLKKQLTDLQYKVTQKEGTERPFENEYWDNKDEGIYVDIISGEPLFSSTHKYKSGTGWPSFTQPLLPENIKEEEDYRLFMKRTEVRSKSADSHLGHVFNDGPAPTGLRYCINSAALKFIPKDKLEDRGYGEFLKLFEEETTT